VVINAVVKSSALNQRVLGGPQDFHGVMEQRRECCSGHLVEIERPLRSRVSGRFAEWQKGEGNMSRRAFRCVIMTKSCTSTPANGRISKVKMIIAQVGSLENGLLERVYFGKEALAVGFGSDRQETSVIR